MITRSERAALIAAAARARHNAYCPYSRFAVGAALLCGSGGVVSGANIENASFGLTLCAERVALATAVAAGEGSFRALAITAGSRGIVPCGACLQMLSEFCTDIPLYLTAAGRTRVTRLRALLPRRFALRGRS